MGSVGSQRNLTRKIKLALTSVLLVGSIAFCLAIGEFLLWVKGWYSPPPSPPQCIYWDPRICELYQFYEPYGYRLKPSEEMEYFYPKVKPRRLNVISNKHGFRSNRELDEPDSRLRILVLGDSFVFGEGVEEHERFSNVLEDYRPNWRVDNMGMTGWGPDLMLRALVNVGLRQRVDVVVLSIYTDDFRRVHPYYIGVGFPVPRFALKGGALISVPYPVPRLWERSRMFFVMDRAYWSLMGTEWSINRAIFDQFFSLAQAHEFSLVLIFLPPASDSPNDQKRRAWLKNYSNGKEIPFYDFTQALHQESREQVFIPNNPHYNSFGHKLLAQKLVYFLEQEVLPTASPAKRGNGMANAQDGIK